MIHYFKWKNFYSFKDEGEISFEVGQNAPQTYAFAHCGDTRLSKIGAVFGPNASGKTNILQIMAFIRHFIMNSFHNKSRGFHGYSPYMRTSKESWFEVGFFINEIYYIYSSSLNNDVVLSEELRKKSPHLITVFERDKQNFKGINFGNTDTIKLFDQLVRSNVSVISAFSQINHSEMQMIRDFWNYKLIAPFLFPHNTKNLMDLINRVSTEYLKDSDLFSRMQDILNELDLGNYKLDFKQIYMTMPQQPNVRKLHTMPFFIRSNEKINKNFPIPLNEESSGVINLFLKLYPILIAIKQGCFIVIDELDRGIHSKAVLRILNLFKENNKGQILFTSHATPLLMDLNKYQVYLTEKNKNNESEVFRLDQVEGIRTEDNLFKKYLSGAYGGFPDIDF